MDGRMAENIRTAHFKTGEGPLAGVSEQRGCYATTGMEAGSNKPLDPDRIKFFKEAHFDHRDTSKPLQEATQHKSTFRHHDKDTVVGNKHRINDGSTAYLLKHQRHTVGEIGKTPTSFVTNDALRMRWI